MSDPAMTAEQRQAASLLWQQHHPLLLLGISTVIAVLIVSLVILLRWFFSRKAWSYHPGGSMGYLKDEFIKWAIVFVPILILGLGIKYYIYAVNRALNTPQVWLGYAAFVIVLRNVVRRLPFMKSVSRHIDAAQEAERVARQGGTNAS